MLFLLFLLNFALWFNWTADDLRHHFQLGYAPNNATMVVVGDVTPEEIFGLAHQYIEPIPPHAPPPKVTTVEPPQLGERRLVVHKYAQLPILMIAFHIPATSHPDYFALQALQTILATGHSSRLYQRLVDKDQLALSVSADFGYSMDPTLLVITAQPRAGIAPAQVEAAIYEELDRLKAGGVSSREAQKASNLLLADFYNSVKTINGRASALGNYEVFFGDYHKLFRAPDDYAKVTPDDIRRVAQAYFDDRNRTVATLSPDTRKEEAQSPPAP